MDAARPATPLEAAPAPATADGPRAGVGESQSLGKGLGPTAMPSSSIPAAAVNGSASSSSTAVLPASTSPGNKHADASGATASQAHGPTQQGTQQPGQEVLKQGEPTAGSGQPPESSSPSKKSTPAAGPSAAAPAAASSNPAPPSATSAAPAARPPTPAPAPTPAAGPGKAGPKLPPRKVPNHSTGASTSSSATGTASASAPGKAATTGQAAGSSPSPSKPAEASSSSKPTKSAFMPSLPPRSAAPTCGPVLDPEEPEAIQKLRKDIHAIRVSLIRAAQRLGYDHENGLVKQVLYRLNLAEKLKAPWRRGKRPDPSQAAAREASRLELEEGANAPLGFTVKMMLIGLTGAGKTQLIHSLLSSGGIGHHAPPPPSSSSPATTAAGAAGAAPHPQGQACDGRPKLVDPFEGQTKKVQVLEGTVHGLRVVCVDTPGLVASASAAGYNGKVLQQIRSAYRRHKPDLVIYVDRLDATASTGGELPALRVLSESLGAGLWLNTIVALTHAGSPPPNGPKGPMSFDAYANQRSHLLQQVIRSASGDNRLMNPTAFVDSHPNCELNAAGQAVIANGMPWKAHLYLMIVSAKLLADTEGMLQMQDGSSPAGAGAAAAANAAAMQQMMMGGAAPTRQLPLPYLMSSLTQFSRPVKYPDHDLVIDTRLMEKAVGTAPDGKQARGLVRQVKARLLQLRQAHANKERMQRSFRNATLAGGKVTPEPPRLATKRAPSVHPPATFRYRVPEPSDGWVVRPHIEHHGMDHSDGIEGLYLEKMAVAGRNLQDRAEDAPSTSGSVGGDGSAGVRKKRGKGRSDVDLLLGGVPYRHYVSAQCNKEHKAVQVRSEATLYHDPLGKSTSTLSADIQSSGGAGGMPMDALCTLRADLRRRGILGEQGKATLGLLATRIAEGCRPHRGPMAVGGRLQQTMTPPFPGSSHCKLSAAAAYLTTLPGSGVADAMLPDREGCLGGNLELMADMQPLAGTRDPLSLTLSTNAIRYRGEVMTGVAAALQCQASRSEMWGGRVQVGNKGKAALSIKVKSTEHWWAGVAAMVMPLGTLLLQSVGLMR